MTDNLDIGRPELIELIFKRGQRRGRPARGEFKTKIVTYGTEVNVNAFYRHSRIKQYLKDGRALRIETVINDPGDLGCLRRLAHLDELQARARAVNTALLDTERVGQGCVLASPAFERIARPTLTEDGRRAPALRFGDPRVQAQAGALCTNVVAVTGITNKSLRALMTGLLGGANYTMNQASYDLARLRVNALITRIPGKNRYRLTGDGLRFAIFYTKLHDRLLRPLLAADQPPAPVPLRKALHTIDIHITETIDQARLLSNVALKLKTTLNVLGGRHAFRNWPPTRSKRHISVDRSATNGRNYSPRFARGVTTSPSGPTAVTRMRFIGSDHAYGAWRLRCGI